MISYCVTGGVTLVYCIVTKGYNIEYVDPVPDWRSRLAARSRKGQVLGSKPGWERLRFCTFGNRDGR